MKHLITVLLLASIARAQSTITHVIYVIKENHSTDELFGTFPGVQNYCQGGNSPRRCTNNQTISCTGLGTHDVCGNGGWCEPIMCTTPNGPECSVGDSCPQITTYQSGGGTPLVLQDPLATYPDIGHARRNFVNQFQNGAMNGWPNTGGINSALTYFGVSQIPFYYQLANTYGLEDNHFSTLGGPSAPNHLYMFSASSSELSDNPASTQDGTGSPGENPLYTHPWTCGALHTGTSPPYLYIGTFPSTLASDGTRYYGGTCSNDRTIACRCTCPAGTTCNDTFNPTLGGSACTAPKCASVGNLCDTSFSIGGMAGAPCPTITTIADVAEANGVSWGYYSGSPQWNAALYSQGIYFNPARLSAHVHPTTQFDTDVAACTGMCSNNHSKACSMNSQCGAGSCIDSDGSPPGSAACTLPKITYLSPAQAANSEHPQLGTMSAGENWTKSRLAPYFANSYVYQHSILLLTWDDWGGYYDHVPPPVQDGVPTLGFRVPLLCVGPYCRNKVTHTQMEFASALKCIEKIFRLPAINSRDAGATDACAGTGTLSNNTDGMVNLSQAPIPAIGQSLFPTSTSLASPLNPSSYGQQVTLTANVTSSSGTPTGTVAFFDGGSSIGTVSLSQGSASISLSALQGGTHSMTASYSGDPLFASSSSNAVSQIVNPAASTATVQSSQSPSPYGLPVTITATIAGAGSAGPTGQVTFFDGTTNLGTSPLSNGNVTLTSSTLSTGAHSITAQYGGDSNYTSTSASLSQMVSQAVTSTSLASSLNPSVVNQPVTFTATVTSQFGGAVTGSVTFKNFVNNTILVIATVPLTNGQASCPKTFTGPGSHLITATYSGDSNNQTSTSASLSQLVNQAVTSTSLASSLNPALVNQPVTFAATVTPQFGGPVTGSVTFNNNFNNSTTVIATVPLTNGQASSTKTFTGAGTHSITATYSGDSNNLGSTSSTVSQIVNLDPTTTGLSSSANPSTSGQSVTFTARVTSTFGAIPDGEPVIFFDGTVQLASVPLAAGVATYTTSSLRLGQHAIKATYGGDSTFASSSKSLTQTVH